MALFCYSTDSRSRELRRPRSTAWRKKTPPACWAFHNGVSTGKVKRTDGQHGSKGFFAERCRGGDDRFYAGCTTGRGHHQGEDDWDPGGRGFLLRRGDGESAG